MHIFRLFILWIFPILCCLHNRGMIRPSHKQSAASAAHHLKGDLP
nr:MAG TPA: hypothetical protein [Caudoviricetes sp.]DAS15518.1 MAG TPA: hypothetical protein [Caudoviricetes sp.]